VSHKEKMKNTKKLKTKLLKKAVLGKKIYLEDSSAITSSAKL
jgi:hypothetical protein